MYITNVTDYNMSTLCNCTNNENNIEIILPFFTIIPCGMSLICLLSLKIYILIKLLYNKN